VREACSLSSLGLILRPGHNSCVSMPIYAGKLQESATGLLTGSESHSNSGR
jgi:hypothetical protein